MSFKVGDWVRVKHYENIDWNGFTENMKKYCGHSYRISSIDSTSLNNYYKLEGCGSENTGYYTFRESCLGKAVDIPTFEIKPETLDKIVQEIVEMTNQEPIIFGNLNKTEDKEMNKQKTKAAERTRIKDKMAEYIYKSSIRSINVIVPNQVVEVEFTCGDKIKTVCNKDDTFSLERAVYIAIAKKRFGHIYTSDGIEKKATELTYEKDYVYRVKNALKVYECQQQLAALDKEEEEIKLRQKQKRHERNERRRARRAEEAAKKEEERRNEQIAIQKEAYLQAMREFEEERKKIELEEKKKSEQVETTDKIDEKVEKLISDVENTEVKKEDTESKAIETVAENNEKKNKVEESTNNAKETENKEE